jgi:hypothetical protein
MLRDNTVDADDLDEFAVNASALFGSLRGNGFSGDQAMTILVAVITATAGQR